MTHTQKMQAMRKTEEYKVWKRQTVTQMKLAHAAGQDVSRLANCPDSYQIALKIKYSNK